MRTNLRNARQFQGLTQEQTAERIGISVRQYKNLEYGLSDGSVRVWLKLAKLFKKSINYLLLED